MRHLFWASAVMLSILGMQCSPPATNQKAEASLTSESTVKGFPFYMNNERPDMPLSAALERNYSYEGTRPETNELYSQFKYTKLEGFDYNGGDGTISRRDPSKIIFENGKYYVYYTHRETPVPPVGVRNAHLSTDVNPSADWDLADIYYATSEDGFTWKEQGVAVPRPPKPAPGWRSVTTTDILKFNGKFYLYYQAFSEASGKSGGDNCPVAVSYADSPDGPWTAANKVVIPNGGEGEWDQYSIHDPYPMVHDGKIYLYYKSDFGGSDSTNTVRMHGLAIADDPLGPFEKHPLNPVMNSGHETTLFPYKKGVAAFAIRDGNEMNTIQYAEDWVNFEIASCVQNIPDAAGPYVPDAFTNTTDGRGITWGISHYTVPGGNWKKNHAVLLRFDCDLSRDLHDPQMQKHYKRPSINYLYQQKLSGQQMERIKAQNEALRAKSE
ncbi:glycoside hydrolase family 117 protein [Reichenbachiella versicolor]|uniref:glycoside hydrolase family 117 protein n=1 Tax=Reichenbachiella versicolor TaxID=1821036 RepID=UPI000D6DDEAC|nr:family 43 glycosylhydrolase [Reichenbachiella versicolor]